MGEVGVSTRGAAHGRLLERERELAVLAEAVGRAVAGEGGLALVEGAAGIGKTRLVGEARLLGAEAGLRVLAARGGELEREFPFGVVRQLFEPVLVDEELRARAFAGAAAPARPVFEAFEDAGEAQPDASFAVLHGLFWLTVNLAGERSLLLAFDDLHWCDHPSLRFLAYLVRRLEGLPVLAVAGLRPSEPGVDRALLAELAGDPLTTHVQPGDLSRAAVGELVRERLAEEPHPAFVDACREATGGNPLLLGELLKALAGEGVRPLAENVAMVNDLGPRAASRAVLVRLARLSGEAAAVAAALAVLGDGADLNAVAALAELDEQEAARATAELTRAEILRGEPPLGFVHPLVGAAVYQDLSPGERALRHERAASVLGELGASDERVAAQLLLVPPRGDPATVDLLRRAAAAALPKGAAESGAAYLERALAEPPRSEQRTDVLLELGRAEIFTNGPAAVEHLREAHAALTDPVARAYVAQGLGGALLFTGRPADGGRVAREAADALDSIAELEDLRLTLEAFALGARLFEGAEFTDFVGGRPLPELGQGLGARAVTALVAYARAHACEPAEEPVRLALAALAGGALVAVEPSGIPTVAALLVLVFADRNEVLGHLDEALAAAHRSGSLFGIGGVRLFRGLALLRRGELAEAQEELEITVEHQRTWGYGIGPRLYASAFLGATLVELGELGAAGTVLPDAEEPDFVSDGTRFWLNAKLELLVAERRDEEALRIVERLRADYDHVRLPAAGHWRSLAAEALDRLGRHDEAVAAATEELELARRWGAPGSIGRALRVLGTVQRDEGIDELREAVDVLEPSPARLELAKALAALGAALRRARRPGDSREPLRRALELAEVCGAAGLAEWARAELYAAGARPRSTALSGVAALTASEQRVAALAADGQTNRDIAQALFVTPKTVEVHLTNAYRKLGIGSRRQLAAALAAG